MSGWAKGRKRASTVSVSGYALLRSPYVAHYGSARGSAVLKAAPTPPGHLRGLLGLLFHATKGS